MKYPRFLQRFNGYLGTISGALFFIIAILQAYNSIARYFFASPSLWIMDISRYLLIWSVFIGTAYAWQEKGHVGVDILLLEIEKLSNVLKRILIVGGYLASMSYICILLYRSVIMMRSAMRIGKLTTAFIQIPMAYLYIAMILGCIAMIVTIFFIILSVIHGEEKYS